MPGFEMVEYIEEKTTYSNKDFGLNSLMLHAVNGSFDRFSVVTE